MFNKSLYAYKLEEFKALLCDNRATLPYISFVPLRTVTWKGDVVAYKVRPLLADESGCMTIRITPNDMQEFISLAQADSDLHVRAIRTRLFSVKQIDSYQISLLHTAEAKGRTQLSKISLYDIPSCIEKRCEPDWKENEGYAITIVSLDGNGNSRDVDV